MKTFDRALTIISCCLLALGGSVVQGQDWSQWQGPNRDGKAADFKAPQTWPTELNQKWKVEVGDGVATPVLVGNHLYTFTRQEGSEVIRCLDAATGKELWQDKYDVLPPNGPSASHSGPRSTPAVADGKVVTLGVRGTVSCYDATNGKLLWRKDDFKDSLPRFFTSSSPLITDGSCIVQLGGGDTGGVVAYDLASGNDKWKWTGGGAAYASPTLLTVAGTKMVVAETDNKIVGLAVEDGSLLWETPFPLQGRGGYNASTPVADGNTLIYCGSGRGATAVKIEKDGDGYAAKELWKNPDNSVQFNTPVLKDGMLYGLSANNVFFCNSAADGKTAWTAPLAPSAPGAAAGGQGGGRRRGGMGGGGYGSIVDAGSVLLALTPSSELIAIQPNEKQYTELARIKVADSPTYAYPVISGNRVFIKDQDSVTLYTLD